MMLRTTLGLKDDINSDTVSTEFNYLNPITRKLEFKDKTSDTHRETQYAFNNAPDEIQESLSD